MGGPNRSVLSYGLDRGETLRPQSGRKLILPSARRNSADTNCMHNAVQYSVDFLVVRIFTYPRKPIPTSFGGGHLSFRPQRHRVHWVVSSVC